MIEMRNTFRSVNLWLSALIGFALVADYSSSVMTFCTTNICFWNSILVLEIKKILRELFRLKLAPTL